MLCYFHIKVIVDDAMLFPYQSDSNDNAILFPYQSDSNDDAMLFPYQSDSR